MQISIGIDSTKLMREASVAVLRALAFSSSVAGDDAEDLLLVRPDQRPRR